MVNNTSPNEAHYFQSSPIWTPRRNTLWILCSPPLSGLVVLVVVVAVATVAPDMVCYSSGDRSTSNEDQRQGDSDFGLGFFCATNNV
jgi:hypothetical protein